MEEKTNQLLAQAKKIMGNDADVMIVVHKNGQFSSTLSGNHENSAMAIFTAITQGILVAGLSTYVNQVIKQVSKEE